MTPDRFKVAIQWDDYGPGDSAAPLFTRYLADAGHEVRRVDVFRADIMTQVAGCDGFMWRFAHFPDLLQIARRLLPVLERELGMAVYPDENTRRHYDDKIAQSHLFSALDIPCPRTWVWFDRDAALVWAQRARYPLVMKLSGGAGSENVLLVDSFARAKEQVDRLFGAGVRSLRPVIDTSGRRRIRLLPGMLLRDGVDYARYLLRGIVPHPRPDAPPAERRWEIHKNYALFQEFLPGNAFDTRVTVIGNRAFAFRRFNRPGDFRASGSGRIDFDPGAIDTRFVRLAFETARRLRAQSCAIDGLLRGDEAVVGEVSYTYALWAIHKCPGHWDETMNWHAGHMEAEAAIVSDFLERLKSRALG